TPMSRPRSREGSRVSDDCTEYLHRRPAGAARAGGTGHRPRCAPRRRTRRVEHPRQRARRCVRRAAARRPDRPRGLPPHEWRPRRTGKGCLSYLIGSSGDAAVVDASLEPQIYHRVVDEHGWRIRTVVETHVHADHVSRARALAADTGARLCLPTTDRFSFEYAPVKEGDIVHVGAAGLRALHTPGHTPESVCYLLDERAVFTGDTLFLAVVGRPAF